jgi:hypothetical protein
MESALNPLAEHLTCEQCRSTLTDRIKNLIAQWSIVRVRPFTTSDVIQNMANYGFVYSFREQYSAYIWFFYLVNLHGYLHSPIHLVPYTPVAFTITRRRRSTGHAQPKNTRKGFCAVDSSGVSMNRIRFRQYSITINEHCLYIVWQS